MHQIKRQLIMASGGEEIMKNSIGEGKINHFDKIFITFGSRTIRGYSGQDLLLWVV